MKYTLLKGRAKRRATGKLTGFLSLIQSQVGLPRDFWLDPMVLGFAGATIIFELRKISELTPERQKEFFLEVIEPLSHLNGRPLYERFVYYFQQHNADFKGAFDVGFTVSALSDGLLSDEEENELVQQARQSLSERGVFEPDRHTIAETILTAFMIEMVDRFDE